MASSLEDPVPRAFDPVADIFEPASPDPTADITLIIEAAGAHSWVLHRSDGRCGGIFVDRKSALHEARQEASMLADAVIVIAEAGGPIARERFQAGRPVSDDQAPRRPRAAAALARAA